jgi:hypothetical protein
MVAGNKNISKISEIPGIQQVPRLGENEKAMKLVTEILAGKFVDIKPQLDFSSEMGFLYPTAEQTLGIKGKEVIPILDSLTDKGVLKKEFFDRLLYCPQCRSINLRPTIYCPQCSSASIARGRVLEHALCGYVGLEDEFVDKGRYVCPKCKVELRNVGSDYRSLGILRKCRNCGEVFTMPSIKWHCLRCSAISPEDKVVEVNIYSYRFKEEKRSWLEFQLKPKFQLIEFLRERGYEVMENAILRGRSGAEHTIDILASKDDGVIIHNIAIAVKVAGDKIGLDEIFDFDDKAYDAGIHDKILVVLPGMRREAEKFASQQRIKVLEVKDLETVLSGSVPPPMEIKREPFEFRSKSKLIKYLRQYGYEVKENATLKGRSGAEHKIDLLATRDEGIVIHHIAIGIEMAEELVGLDRVFDFDDKAYDIGILDKAIIAIPGLTKEAKQFAQRQKIRVFEVKELEPSS